MKIGIDFSRGFSGRRTGTEEYAYQLIKAFSEIKNSRDEFFLYVKKKTSPGFVLPENFHLIEIKRKFLWTQLGLSLEMLKRPVDVLFIPSHSIPLFHPKNTVVTVHGLEYERFSDCYSFLQRSILRINTFFSARFARGIITPSLSTKKDLVGFYKINPEKIRVIHHGFGHEPKVSEKHVSKSEIKKNKFNVLFIGRFDKRKNVLGILESFFIFLDRQKKEGIQIEDIKLILCGSGGNQYEKVQQKVRGSAFKDNVIMTGYVSLEEKVEFYKKADAFLFPSFCEGFGLPLLEAMSFGVPVVCSDISVFREVGGEAPIFVNPSNYEEISKVLKKIYQDVNMRENMSRKGFENIKNFNWQKCASETLEFMKINKK